MDIREDLKSAGVYPTGPVSAWPEERHLELTKALQATSQVKPAKKVSASAGKMAEKVSASAGKMAKGLAKTASQAMRHGKVSEEIREERYNTCKACPLFLKDSKRCSDCGCFMELKTWVGGDPDALCPQKKWSR